jgi:hypothetical protein
MSVPQKDGEIGYKRPPKGTQWKKGQCGNPKKKYPRSPKASIRVDNVFAEEIEITDNGVARRVTILEAIFLQLLAKEASGSKRAAAVRLKYEQAYAHQRGPQEFIVVGGLPTRSGKNERL